MPSQPHQVAGAVRTTAGAVVPVTGELVTGGLLRQWQERNRRATIPHTIDRLRAAGNLDNLRRLLPGDGDAPPYRGRYPFLDTDLYKTLEGLAYEPGEPGGPADEFFDEVVTLLEQVQAPDGYLNSFFQDPAAGKKPWEDLAWGHELYNLGHLVQAAVAAARRRGDERLLAVAVRFADLVVRRFGEDGEAAVCGHPEVEMALVELYRQTGERAYLTQARLFVDRRGTGTLQHRVFPPDYFQDHVPLREMPTVTGHAVRMAYLAAGAADVAIETGDRGLLAALERLWDDMAATKLYLTGGLGSRHSDEAIGDRYELPSERSYSETCAAVAVMQWAWRMFVATGGAKYLDVFERVLYNAYAVGLSAEGTAFFYDNPLQRRPDHEQRSGAETGGEPLRRAWFGCPCCPPNIVRWTAQLGDHLAAERGDALLIGQYTRSRLGTAELGVAVETAYPWDGDVRVRVERAPDRPYAIVLRVPGWAREVTLDGEPVTAVDGWLTVERRWTPGDVLRLRLAMPVRAHVPHPYVDAARGSVALARGPLVYCVEQQDAPVPVDDLVLDPARATGAALTTADEPPGAADRPPGAAGDVLRGAVLLSVPAYAAPPPPAELYPEFPAELTQGPTQEPAAEVAATFVPYFLWGNRRPEAMRVWVRAQ
ncbi:glycoside hydrolase family 127 protein [Actinomadura sp. ATCC 31491]|uniref:Glycoside hydrolase family 127 protein n=1 Tax=Actinomadura luzonensis TaxID=2805427 RepID=A0ABT0G2F7_9ACTN|nr:beta-L-arabinofuranosidase domain-containing protein [Actinomadura luzonensis]MCK2218796.1 glycoside hydrolase family 127 protein [Actinomadura luzonensis]